MASRDQWFAADNISNFDDWQKAFEMQSSAEQREREFIQKFLPKLLMYLGGALAFVLLIFLLIPSKKKKQ